MPEEFRLSSLSDFADEVRSFVASWMASPGYGLLIVGEAGTGKTHLAWAIFRELAKPDDYSANSGLRPPGAPETQYQFHSSFDFYRKARQFRMASAEEEGWFIQELCEIKMLWLDDIASGSLSDFQREALLEILSKRREHRLPVVLTSNWDVVQIAEKMDDRIGSRLKGLTILRLEGKDRRERR